MRSLGRGFHGHWIRGVSGTGRRSVASSQVFPPRPATELNGAAARRLPALRAPDGSAEMTTLDLAADGIGGTIEVDGSAGYIGQPSASETVVSIQVVGPDGVRSDVRVTHPGPSNAVSQPLMTPPYGPDASAVEHVTEARDEDYALPEDTSAQPAIEMFEGVVHLNVSCDSGMPPVIRFVRELRRSSELRLLRLAGDASDVVAMVVRLREPIPLLDLLSGIPVVSEVSASSASRCPDGSEPLVSVRLRDREPLVEARVE